MRLRSTSPDRWKPEPRVKAAFFGTSEFAVPSLRATASETELRAVITQPDRPAGRGQRLRASPVKAAAGALHAPVYEPRTLRELPDHALADCDVLVVASYGKILPQRILDAAAAGALNVHPSLLPTYRGATPIQTALRNGDAETGVSIIQMDAGMDTGPIYVQERTPIAPAETYGELHDRLAILGATLLARVLRGLPSGGFEPRAQSGGASITRPLRKDDLTIAWDRRPVEIANQVRAYAPLPAARAVVGGATLKVLRASPCDGGAEAAPGAVLAIRGESLVVACRGGAVMLQSVIPPNRGPMSGAAFARAAQLLP